MMELFDATQDREAAFGPAARDFDFLHGDWRVSHRRLRRRLAGDDEWQEFGGRISRRPIIGGLGNVDDNLIDLPEGSYRAASLRLFDTRRLTWAIWWADGRRGNLEPPVIGGFQDGVGIFLGRDQHEGRFILVRFTWSGISTKSANWAQAFSPDEGQNWETNWTMTFARIDRSD
jgi:hypothetical protein